MIYKFYHFLNLAIFYDYALHVFDEMPILVMG